MDFLSIRRIAQFLMAEAELWLAPACEVNCRRLPIQLATNRAECSDQSSAKQQQRDGFRRVPPWWPRMSKAPSGFPVPLLIQVFPPSVDWRSRPFTPWLFRFHAHALLSVRRLE